MAAAFLLYAGRALSFHYDEWDFIQRRRGTSPDTFLRPHNGHLSALPIAYYKAMLQIFGLHHYWVYRLVVVALHTVAAWLLFWLLRPRLGPVLGSLGAMLLLFLGASWENLVWGIGVGFLGSVVAGLAMLVALDRESRHGNVVAAVALTLALGCSSIGVPFLILAVVELGVRRRWRRLAGVVAPAVVLYGVWLLGWGSEHTLLRSNLAAVPAYVFDMAAAAFAALAGLAGTPAGATFAVLAAVAVVVAANDRNPSSRHG